ncbi:MAG: AbrB/MazE/SpoVT family DNA-binding domain-containing protein [Nocardioides sp.]|nr:AbrB/MazE/SpoVT family DNA-binding domain-containing protein [Nocardioides sp.]
MITKLFKSNRTQAVRLPKDVAFGDDVTEVTITAVGDTRIVAPAAMNPMEVFFSTTKGIPDFPDRDQPMEDQERDWPWPMGD